MVTDGDDDDNRNLNQRSDIGWTSTFNSAKVSKTYLVQRVW